MFPYKSQGHFGPQRKPQAILPCLGLLAETSTSIFFVGRKEEDFWEVPKSADWDFEKM
jgi:hypothetical protein